MQPTELILIAIALAMDAFAVSIASGCMLKCVDRRQTFRLAWHFGLFQAMMPILGWLLGATVREYIEAYDHWIAFILLAYIGINMIRESFGDDDEERCDPTRGMRLIMLSVATSIDALAVGLTLSMLGVSIWWPALIIGIVAAGFTVVGLKIGQTAAKAKRIGQYAELLGGSVLIGIGLKILYEHKALAFLVS